jgi:hypothetical protein
MAQIKNLINISNPSNILNTLTLALPQMNTNKSAPS